MNTGTKDIYWQGRIYQGVNLTDWEFAKAIGEPSIYIALGGLTSYGLIGSHNFTNGQPVQLGKDYEVRYRDFEVDIGLGEDFIEHGKIPYAIPLSAPTEQSIGDDDWVEFVMYLTGYKRNQVERQFKNWEHNIKTIK